jgi:carboxypeptidase PM20D1
MTAMALAMVGGTLWVLVALLGLSGLLLFNTLRFRRRPTEVPAVEQVPIDVREAAERLAEAIRFPTVASRKPEERDPKPFQDLHDFLRRAYPRVHLALTREVVNEWSLLYTWQGTDPARPPILLMAHLDVVPVDPATEGEWEKPPFAGVMADGYVWGRGALDNKASALGILEAVERLMEQGFQPACTVYLAFGHDEEVGGNSGARHIASLLASRGVRLEFLLDEGLVVGHGLIPGVAAPVAMIGVAEKGLMTLELTARGAGGHASMPPSRTVIGRLGGAIQRIEATPMRASIRGPVRQLFDRVGPEMPFVRRAVFANLWLFEPLVTRLLARGEATNAATRTTIAVTKVTAGCADNVLPPEAKAVLNVRILPGDDMAGVIEHVRRVIDDPQVSIRVVSGAEPSFVSATGSPSFRALSATISQVFPGAVVAPGLFVAGSDSRHYLSLTGAAYRFLPLRMTQEDLGRIHGRNERIATESYAEVIAFYAQLIQNSAAEGREWANPAALSMSTRPARTGTPSGPAAP